MKVPFEKVSAALAETLATELALLSVCRHPNLVQMLDAFIYKERITIVLEYARLLLICFFRGQGTEPLLGIATVAHLRGSTKKRPLRCDSLFFRDTKGPCSATVDWQLKRLTELIRCSQEPHIAYFVREILTALVYLHQTGIAHRDVKADNVLLLMDGSIKLADMGVAIAIARTLCRFKLTLLIAGG